MRWPLYSNSGMEASVGGASACPEGGNGIRLGVLPWLRGLERGQDRACSGPAVERVEVDPGRSRPEQLSALLGRVRDPEPELDPLVPTRAVHRGDQRRRDVRFAQL